jgi:hypothetical protein
MKSLTIGNFTQNVNADLYNKINRKGSATLHKQFEDGKFDNDEEQYFIALAILLRRNKIELNIAEELVQPQLTISDNLPAAELKIVSELTEEEINEVLGDDSDEDYIEYNFDQEDECPVDDPTVYMPVDETQIPNELAEEIEESTDEALEDFDVNNRNVPKEFNDQGIYYDESGNVYLSGFYKGDVVNVANKDGITQFTGIVIGFSFGSKNTQLYLRIDIGGKIIVKRNYACEVATVEVAA